MDKMSLFTVLTVSAPEALSGLIIGFLIFGLKEKILPNKNNLIRMFISVLLMVNLTFAVRSYIPLGPLTLIISVVGTVFIFKFVFDIKWGKAIGSTLIFIGMIGVLEEIFLPPLFIYLQKTAADIYGDDIIRLVCSLPERLIQAGMIISLWNFKNVLVDYDRYKKIQLWFNTIMIVLYAGEMIELYEFLSRFNTMILKDVIMNITALTLFVIANVALFKFLTNYTKVVKVDESVKHIENIKELRNTIDTIM